MENNSTQAPTGEDYVKHREEVGEKHFMLGYLNQRATDYNLAWMWLRRGLGLGIRCVVVRSNYLLSWKARSLGKEELHGSATRKN